jgi:hypothetical protein
MDAIQTLFVANREGLLEIVYYCPVCEAVNALIGRSTDRLLCHECRTILTAAKATLEIVHPPEREQS